MLTADEEHAVAEQFGVDPEQVRRDHLISHLLAADQTVSLLGSAVVHAEDDPS